MEVSSTFLNPMLVYRISISFALQLLHPMANNHPLRAGYKNECTPQLVCKLWQIEKTRNLPGFKL